MRNVRELVALLLRVARPISSSPWMNTEEHDVRKKVPTRRAVFSDGSPRHHQPPTTRVAGTRTTMRAERESRAIVRTDRTAWLSGYSSSLRCCHISSDTHLQPPYHKPLQHLEIASPQIRDLDTISYHRQAIGTAKRLAIEEVGQVRNLEDDIGVPKGP